MRFNSALWAWLRLSNIVPGVYSRRCLPRHRCTGGCSHPTASQHGFAKGRVRALRLSELFHEFLEELPLEHVLGNIYVSVSVVLWDSLLCGLDAKVVVVAVGLIRVVINNGGVVVGP